MTEANAAVHVIDDDALVRQALNSLLRSVGFEVCTHETTDSYLAAPRENGPSCLLLDVRLKGASGLDFQADLATRGITVPVIVMTGYGDIPMSVRAMKAGAVDFLTKPFRDQDLLDAVTTTLARESRRRMQDGERAALVDRYRTLSDRERQVMRLVTDGMMNKQAAFELGLSEITIKFHRAAAMRKMGARSLAELVRMAGQLGLDEET
ncbi:response regulator transcription factor [Aquibium microcysteis]|uniref:response regulator transcription factor n=1 Tax=Aquibium microcysteis TaxID=675281 RepID=UPI00165D04DC|nr:response regulator [Aquibium microcysteis]